MIKKYTFRTKETGPIEIEINSVEQLIIARGKKLAKKYLIKRYSPARIFLEVSWYSYHFSIKSVSHPSISYDGGNSYILYVGGYDENQDFEISTDYRWLDTTFEKVVNMFDTYQRRLIKEIKINKQINIL